MRRGQSNRPPPHESAHPTAVSGTRSHPPPGARRPVPASCSRTSERRAPLRRRGVAAPPGAFRRGHWRPGSLARRRATRRLSRRAAPVHAVQCGPRPPSPLAVPRSTSRATHLPLSAHPRSASDGAWWLPRPVPRPTWVTPPNRPARAGLPRSHPPVRQLSPVRRLPRRVGPLPQSAGWPHCPHQGQTSAPAPSPRGRPPPRQSGDCSPLGRPPPGRDQSRARLLLPARQSASPEPPVSPRSPTPSPGSARCHPRPPPPVATPARPPRQSPRRPRPPAPRTSSPRNSAHSPAVRDRGAGACDRPVASRGSSPALWVAASAGAAHRPRTPRHRPSRALQSLPAESPGSVVRPRAE